MGADGIHLIFLFSFDKLTRLNNEVWTKLRCLSIQREERSMEDSVYLPNRGKSKAISIERDDLRNFERTFLLRGQLSRGEVDLQVTRV